MNKRIGFLLARLLASIMLILIPLIACGTDTTNTDNTNPPTSNAPDFSLSVSGAVSAAQGAQVQTDISITRTNGFSEAVTLSVNGLPAGVTPTFTPNPSDGASSVLNLAVARSVAPGDYPLTLEGNTGSVKKTTPLVLTVTPSPIDIATVAIQGNGSSTQVRQGAGVITVGVTGRGLKDISSASLGTLSGTVVTNNDKAASLTFTIPSGAEVGPQTLQLETPLGVIEQEEAVIISKITASNAGDDTTGKGTPDKPFKTMNFAIGQAGSGDTVRLLDGTYNQASGETFPFTFPSGVTLMLEGESETGTMIEGTGIQSCLVATASEVALSTMTVKDCNSGVDAQDTAVLTINNATLDGNTFGLEVRNTAQVRMENSTVKNSNIEGVVLFDDSRLEIRGGSLSRNGDNGVQTFQTVAGVLRLEGVTLDSNGDAGLLLRTEGTVEVFDLLISNSDFGVLVINLPGLLPTLLNLGDATKAGNNTINNNSVFQLSDERPENSSGNPLIITAIGNTIGGTGATPSGLKTGIDFDGTSWQITSAGNQIDFGP
jgi:hypothetical protein